MNKLPEELEIQRWIQEKLTEKDLYPFNIFFTKKPGPATLGITFYTEIDLEDMLEILEYKSICDKSDYLIFPESNTLITIGEGILWLEEKLNGK